MAEKDFIDVEKTPKTRSDYLTLIIGFMGALKILLAAPPFNIEIAQESVDSWANMAAFVLIGVAIFRNNRRKKAETYNTTRQ